MAVVAVLRAVNLGHRTLRTSALASDLGLVNFGAAGTFVAPGAARPAQVAMAIRKSLPFETEVIALPGAEVLALLDGPLGRPPPAGVQRFVTFLAREVDAPRLPLDRPEGAPWVVRIAALSGRVAVCLRRPRKPGDLYPNLVVEKVLGVPATTRTWATVEAVGRALRSRSAPAG